MSACVPRHIQNLLPGIRREQMPTGTNRLRAKTAQTVCRQGGEQLTQVSCCVYLSVNAFAGAIPAASTFSEHASTGDTTRHSTSRPSDRQGVASCGERADLRQEATASVVPRPTRATKNATKLLTEYPDLAIILDAWTELPHVVRAAILAMVKDGSV
jgi:hypothetical protein